LDLWAIARYDLSLSLGEFEELTPASFQALCKRRNIRFKYERFTAAIVASAIYNVNRPSADAPLVQPFDFIREADPELEQTNNIKQMIKQAVGNLPEGTSTEQYQEVRVRTIASLESQGRKDATQLFDECWPSLKPKET
jgi:hypothetical protein